SNGDRPQLTNILRDQFSQAMRTLVNEIEADLWVAAYKGSSRAYGTAATTPFGTANDLSDFAGVRQILDDNGAPQTDLHLVLGSAAMATLRGKQAVLFKVNEAGTADFLRRGVIGDVMGLMLHNSFPITVHTKGTGASYQLNLGAGYAAGSTTFAVDTGSGTILAGDILTNSQAGRDANKYVVNTALSAGSLSIGAPGNRVAWVDNDTVAVGNSYTPNVAFHRNALHLITRAPAMPAGGDGADDVTEIVDPASGLAFQVALYRQYRQISYEVGMAWGVRAVKSAHIATLIG
ncbi:MAG: P22 coat - protein 5 family protein, partial [Caulobacteraceae bacterium]|nr:P22 coat - protein 5 family protein [Caulobacteraceae bacterium]